LAFEPPVEVEAEPPPGFACAVSGLRAASGSCASTDVELALGVQSVDPFEKLLDR
jgi:hypothetical protein